MLDAVDTDFALKAATQKMELEERLSAVLGGKVKPSTFLDSLFVGVTKGSAHPQCELNFKQ